MYKTQAVVTDQGGNARGPVMTLAQAQEIVDVHNLDNDPKPILDFSNGLRELMAQKLLPAVDTENEPSAANYWKLIALMEETITARLRSALDTGFVASRKAP